MKITILGLSITSSWGNGHATTWRALVSALQARGHEITFLERDVPWYAGNRDQPEPDTCELHLYRSLSELKQNHERCVREADVVIVGSYVPEGVDVGKWVQASADGVTAFYDIDTPITVEKLEKGDHEYLSPETLRHYDLFLSFTGGSLLRELEQRFGARMARALYCSVDPEKYFPEDVPRDLDMGYLGTYSDDRQPTVDKFLIEVARRWPHGSFCVAGPQYPDEIEWPSNVDRIQHLPPSLHCRFYNRQRATLNVTRKAMRRFGWAPSVRLFEAAACGTPIISDTWPGIDEIFAPDREIFLAQNTGDVLERLRDLDDSHLRQAGELARQRVLAEHTNECRARELEHYIEEARQAPSGKRSAAIS